MLRAIMRKENFISSNGSFFLHLLGDKLVGEVSRLVVAEACIQALDIDFTEGQIYEINSVKVISTEDN